MDIVPVTSQLAIPNDDDVVEECDVYLSEASTSGEDIGNVILLQYPLRSSHADESNNHDLTLQQVRYKPRQRRLEVTMAIDTKDASYDRRKAADLSTKAGATGRTINSITYSNKNAAGLHNCAYSVGTFVDGKFVITPLHDIIQLKPNMAQMGESSKTIEETMSEQGPSQVSVRFAREETDATKKKRLASYQHQQALLEEETWKPLACYERHSEETTRLLSLLTIGAAENSEKGPPPNFKLTRKEVLEVLAPPPAQNDSDTSSLAGQPSNILCLATIQELPLTEQIRALLCSVKVMRFRQLLSLLPPKMEERSVLNQVQQFALLIRGCWVVRSDLIYPKGTVSPCTGIQSELLCRARDYVGWCFTRRSWLKRAEVSEFAKIPDDDLYEILRGLASYSPGRGWEFLYASDEDFIANYPSVVERQAAAWKGIENQLNCPPIHQAEAKRQRRISTNTVAGRTERAEKVVERKRRRTGSKSQSDSDTGFTSDPELQNSMKPPRRRRNSSKTGFPPVASPLAVVDQMSQNANLANSNAVGSPKPPGQASVKLEPELASFQGKFNDNFDEIRQKLAEKFARKAVLRHSEILTEIRTCDPSVIKSLNNDKLAELISDVGAVKSIILTQLHSATIYVLLNTPDWPDVRNLVVKLLETCQKKPLRISVVKKACMEHLAQFPNDSELKRILDFYCRPVGNNAYVLIE